MYVNRWRRADRACGERQRKASSMFSEFDWFLKADDDTFVIIENLKALLVDYDTNSPIHFGHHFKALGGFFREEPDMYWEEKPSEDLLITE